jgi:hypothetical protein
MKFCSVYSTPVGTGGGGIKSSWRGNRIETGKNLNPVQKIWGGEVGTFGGKFPPKMPRINTEILLCRDLSSLFVNSAVVIQNKVNYVTTSLPQHFFH